MINMRQLSRGAIKLHESLRDRKIEKWSHRYLHGPVAKGPGDGGAKKIRILARGTEKGPPASPHQRQPSSKITSDSESSVRSCRLPCSPTRFLGPRYECHRVRFLQAERGFESGPTLSPAPVSPTTTSRQVPSSAPN